MMHHCTHSDIGFEITAHSFFTHTRRSVAGPSALACDWNMLHMLERVLPIYSAADVHISHDERLTSAHGGRPVHCSERIGVAVGYYLWVVGTG